MREEGNNESYHVNREEAASNSDECVRLQTKVTNVGTLFRNGY